MTLKNSTWFFLAFLFATQAKSQTSNQLIIGKIDSLYSNILQEPRKIWVHVPDGAGGIYTQDRYPVVYLLDGDAHFPSVVGMIQQLSTGGNDICPKMIIVGIPNTDRWRDLSPTHVNAGPYLDSSMVKTTGGGDNFLSFMEKELMPYIEREYPTAPYRMLIGHSLGGLLTVHALAHHPKLFNSYVAIDPSMWWDDWKLLKEAKSFFAKPNFGGKSLFLGIANTLESGMTIETVSQDTTHASQHIRSILELDKLLKGNMQNKLKYQGKYYSDDTHGSVPLITEYDALRFIFDFYPLKLRGKDYEDATEALPNKIDKICAIRSEKMGYAQKPPEYLYNGLGYQALAAKRFELAERFFKKNIEYYPESFNVYDSYGDYFLEKGDNAQAIIQFEKSVSVKEMPATRQKLLELQMSGAKN